MHQSRFNIIFFPCMALQVTSKFWTVCLWFCYVIMQYTGMMLLEEMASIFLTPYLLLFVVPKVRFLFFHYELDTMLETWTQVRLGPPSVGLSNPKPKTELDQVNQVFMTQTSLVWLSWVILACDFVHLDSPTWLSAMRHAWFLYRYVYFGGWVVCICGNGGGGRVVDSIH